MRLQFIPTLLLSGLFGVAGLTHAAALTYTYTPISVPGSSDTSARGINNAGQIVGAYRDSAGQTHGFLDNNGTYTTVNAPGGTSTTLLGINNSGQIVGTYRDSSNALQLFTGNNGAFTTINVPNGLTPSYPGLFLVAGINDAGQIVGTANRPGQTPSAFQYSNSQFSFYPLGTIVYQSYAGGINNAGQIAITYSDGSQVIPYVYSNENFTQIPSPGGDAVTTGINNAGAIVGTYNNTNASGAFLYSGGTLTTIDSTSSPNFFRIYGINDGGQLIGSGVGGAVLATPTTAAVPEPGSFVLLGCGLVGFALVGRTKMKRQQ